MASGRCGTTTVTYDTRCSYTCWCTKNGCLWAVTCPGPDGKDITTTGTGLVKPPSPDPSRPTHVAFDGPALEFVAFIREHTGRDIDIPKGIGRRIKVDVRGGAAAAVRAAGFGVPTRRG